MTPAGAFLEKARKAYHQGDYERALRIAIEGLKRQPAEEEAAELNWIAAQIHLKNASANQANIYANKGLQASRASGDERLMCKNAITLGSALAQQNHYKEADELWQEAFSLAGISGDTRRQGQILVNRATIKQRRSEHREALAILERASNYLDKAGDYNTLAVCYSRMAFSYVEMNEREYAFLNLEKLYTLAQDTGSEKLMASAFFRRGMIHLRIDEFDDAVCNLEKAARLYRELDDKKNLSFCLCNICLAYIGEGKIENVHHILNEAHSLANECQSKTVINAIELVHAEIAAYRKDKGQVISCYRNALRSARLIGNQDRFLALYHSLSDTLPKLNGSIPGLDELLKEAIGDLEKMGLTGQAEVMSIWLERIRT